MRGAFSIFRLVATFVMMTDKPDTIASKRTKGNNQSLVVPLCSLYFILITSHDCQNGFACISSRPSLLIKRAALGNLKASFHCTHWHRFFPLKRGIFSNPSVSLSKGSSTFSLSPSSSGSGDVAGDAIALPEFW